jgi:activator of 2-hydroxyglutaryl-CoA dehydratase
LDTAIIIGVIIGSVATLALVFGKTVLGVAWTENGTREHEMIQTRNRYAAVQEHLHHADNRGRKVSLKQNENNQKSVQVEINSDSQIKTKSRSQTTVQFKRSSNLNDLINKRVKTSDLMDIGYVIGIDNQLMTVLDHNKQEYAIPTYYIREYDKENVLIDTSIRYLYHYETKGKPHP